MTHWRSPNPNLPISDRAVFFLTVGLALLIAAVGWWTA